MALIQHRKNSSSAPRNPIINIAIFTRDGINGRGEALYAYHASFMTPRQHFHPLIDWELKDCVDMPVPPEYRFAVVLEVLARDPFFALVVRLE